MGEYGLTDYYKDNLEKGLRYQDFVCDQLRKMTPARIIMPYCSQEYQYQHGESASGFEIKFDDKMKSTGNIFIETEEKTDVNIQIWTRSGILRKDNTIYYLIGDYEKAYIFAKKQLQALLLKNKPERLKTKGIVIKENSTHTGRGFIIPCRYLEQDENGSFYCLEVIKFTK